jgi:hypothetical protein
MRQQTTMLNGVTKLCSSVEEVEGRKIKKVVNHLDHIHNMLKKTSIIYQQDLDNTNSSEDFDRPQSGNRSKYDDTKEDEFDSQTFVNYAFQDIKYMENAQVRSIGEICDDMVGVYKSEGIVICRPFLTF